MAGTVAIGIQDFEQIRKNECFYVDKTDFIREWWESKDSVTLIARPRRFGKTLNISMLDYFFSVNYAGMGDLFEGLSVWEDEGYRELQGTYPVISLSFARIKENRYEFMWDKICEIIRNLYIKFFFLRDSEQLTDTDRAYFDRILSVDVRDSELSSALYQLSDFLYRYYGKKVIILLDEYDTPMQEAYVNGFWEEIVSFTRNMFNSAFKTNPYLERAMMTGIIVPAYCEAIFNSGYDLASSQSERAVSRRVSKESIFSDLNNLEVVTTTSDKYATAFGFTQEEVFAALDEYGYADQRELVKYWYDGFIFGKHRDIYNPWSILNFLDKGKVGAYWANTSSNSLVSKLIREGDGGIKTTFEQLLRGGTIRCPIDEQIVYNQLDDEEAIWSLLVASGYLKVLGYEEKVSGKRVVYDLNLTNAEVRDMFYDMVRGWFGRAKTYYNGFARALLAGDLESMNEYMNRVALCTFSYFDTGEHPSGAEPERFYHGFVLGLIVDMEDDYVITSNRESGFGRYDVVIEPKEKTRDAYILEFKVLNKRREATLEDTVRAAHAQIEEKNYEAALTARGIPAEQIRKYAFAFEGKTVLIG